MSVLMHRFAHFLAHTESGCEGSLALPPLRKEEGSGDTQYTFLFQIAENLLPKIYVL